MVRGFYTAASGMVTQEKRLNVHANNIANVSTAGFKKDGLIQGTFGEHMATRMDVYGGETAPEIGQSMFMTTTVDEFTDVTQGAFEATESPYNAAIVGPGYFVVRDAQGRESLTRNGQFALDDEGYLVLPNYGRVQGENGDIQLGNHRFSVTLDGMIYLQDMLEADAEAEEIDRLMIVTPLGDVNDFKKDDAEMFTAAAGFRQVDPMDVATSVKQGILERSNVNIADEMSMIIAAQRSLQTCSQLVKMYDELAETANSRISRVN